MCDCGTACVRVRHKVLNGYNEAPPSGPRFGTSCTAQAWSFLDRLAESNSRTPEIAALQKPRNAGVDQRIVLLPAEWAMVFKPTQ